MNCIIIDDDPVSRKHIKMLCDKVDYIKVIGTYTNPTEAIQIINDSTVDLIFLDIHMPEIDGMSFMKSTYNPPKVIFTTGDQSKAVEAFEVNAVDYLVKPISLPRFLKAIDKIKTLPNNNSSKKGVETVTGDIFIYEEGRHTRLPMKDIAIVEAKGDHVIFKLDNNKSFLTRSSMKKIELKLPTGTFMRVHRSYIVNLTKIVDIEDNSLLINNEVIPVSRTAKADLLNKLNFL